MRPFEIALSVANLLAVGVLLVPRHRARSWTKSAAPLAVLLAVGQILLEGARWQMAPAYALALSLLLIRLRGLAAPGGRHGHRFLRPVGVGFAILVLAVSAALPIVLPVFRFPEPTGPYAIGTVTYHWIDNRRPELFTADPDDHRELMAQVWYPAKQEPSAHHAPYIEDAGAVTPALARLFHLPGFIFSHLRYVTTHAVERAPVASRGKTFPVLICLTGLGGFRSASMFQIQALVSHGYIVVGLDQPGGASVVRLPGGREIRMLPLVQTQALIDQSIDPQPKAPRLLGRPMPNGILPYFARDVSAAIDRLTAIERRSGDGRLAGRMDLDHIGVFGMSLGAMVAAEAAYLDPRVKAVLMMDAAMPANVVRSGLRPPGMWMTRPAGSMRLERRRAGGWPEKAIAQTLHTMREDFEKCAPGTGYYLEMPGMFHMNFTDAPRWSPLTEPLGLTGPVDANRMFAAIDAYSLAFFDRYLQGRSEPLLDGSAKQYPGVIVERR